MKALLEFELNAKNVALVELTARIEELEELVKVADSVDEVYKGWALKTRYLIETVEDEITRYGRISATWDGRSHILYLGDDPYGMRGEKSYGHWKDYDEALLAAKEWVVSDIKRYPA